MRRVGSFVRERILRSFSCTGGVCHTGRADDERITRERARTLLSNRDMRFTIRWWMFEAEALSVLNAIWDLLLLDPCHVPRRHSPCQPSHVAQISARAAM